MAAMTIINLLLPICQTTPTIDEQLFGTTMAHATLGYRKRHLFRFIVSEKIVPRPDATYRVVNF
jgi:hypothetical protein